MKRLLTIPFFIIFFLSPVVWCLLPWMLFDGPNRFKQYGDWSCEQWSK